MHISDVLCLFLCNETCLRLKKVVVAFFIYLCFVLGLVPRFLYHIRPREKQKLLERHGDESTPFCMHLFIFKRILQSIQYVMELIKRLTGRGEPNSLLLCNLKITAKLLTPWISRNFWNHLLGDPRHFTRLWSFDFRPHLYFLSTLNYMVRPF